MAPTVKELAERLNEGYSVRKGAVVELYRLVIDRREATFYRLTTEDHGSMDESTLETLAQTSRSDGVRFLEELQAKGTACLVLGSNNAYEKEERKSETTYQGQRNPSYRGTVKAMGNIIKGPVNDELRVLWRVSNPPSTTPFTRRSGMLSKGEMDKAICAANAPNMTDVDRRSMAYVDKHGYQDG
jgi:hypothetical protein